MFFFLANMQKSQMKMKSCCWIEKKHPYFANTISSITLHSHKQTLYTVVPSSSSSSSYFILTWSYFHSTSVASVLLKSDRTDGGGNNRLIHPPLCQAPGPLYNSLSLSLSGFTLVPSSPCPPKTLHHPFSCRCTQEPHPGPSSMDLLCDPSCLLLPPSSLSLFFS